jgi:hypothetical protein
MKLDVAIDGSEFDREERQFAYIVLSGKHSHSNDCATSIAPAEEPGPCDCHKDKG